MYLKRLKLANFKNYTALELDFSSKMNCLVGNNGVGKTNILDAIHYLSVCKSYFQPLDSLNINHEQDFFAIHGDFSGAVQVEQVSCVLKKGSRKQVKLNKKEYERLSEHIGLFPVVMISPCDSDLILEGSEIRRKFMDVVISQFDRPYLENLIAYNTILEQRNRLLKNNFVDDSLLAVFDEQLARYAIPVMDARRSFFEKFLPLFQDYFKFVSNDAEQVEIAYITQIEDEADFLEKLKKTYEKDKILQYTTVGVHKDDLKLLMNSVSVKKYASQGQQKSFTIAMRLAQFEFTKEVKGFSPVLLLDDVFDKLDENRVGKLIELVGNQQFGQVFITDTDQERLERILNTQKLSYKMFTIKNNEHIHVTAFAS